MNLRFLLIYVLVFDSGDLIRVQAGVCDSFRSEWHGALVTDTSPCPSEVTPYHRAMPLSSVGCKESAHKEPLLGLLPLREAESAHKYLFLDKKDIS